MSITNRFRLNYRQFIKIRFCDALPRPITTTTPTFFFALSYVTTTTVTSRYTSFSAIALIRLLLTSYLFYM